MINIGIDIMGGDLAPQTTVLGAILARKILPSDVNFVLFGDENSIKEICKKEQFNASAFKIVHTSEVIEMGDNPAKAFTQKQNSSIAAGFHLLSKGQIDGFASAGNTGAMLVGAMYTVKSIEGVIRPAISTIIPLASGKVKILLDVGINPDCKPEILCQWGILGSIYAESVHGIKNPSVGLLNIGSEEEKGNILAKSTFPLMKESKQFNFFGNMEGNDLFDESKADIIICDGFVGNVLLKTAEAFYELIKHRGKSDEYFDKFNFEMYGGTPILGVNKPVIIGHGISNDIAIKNMILTTKNVIEADLCGKIKQALTI